MFCHICGNKFKTLLEPVNKDYYFYYCNSCFLIYKKTQNITFFNLIFIHDKSTNILFIKADTTIDTNIQKNNVLQQIEDYFTVDNYFDIIHLDNIIQNTIYVNEILNICNGKSNKITTNVTPFYLNKKQFVYKSLLKNEYNFFTTSTLRYISSKNNMVITKSGNLYEFANTIETSNDLIIKELLSELQNEIYNESLYRNYKLQYLIYKTILTETVLYNISKNIKVAYLYKSDEKYIDFFFDSTLTVSQIDTLTVNDNTLVITFSNIEYQYDKQYILYNCN